MTYPRRSRRRCPECPNDESQDHGCLQPENSDPDTIEQLALLAEYCVRHGCVSDSWTMKEKEARSLATERQER